MTPRRPPTPGAAITYDERAERCFEAVLGDNPDELMAYIDEMDADDLYELAWRGEKLAQVARTEWLAKTRRPGR